VAKIAAGVALAAGAAALEFIPGAGQVAATFLTNMLPGMFTAAQVSSAALMMGTMGAGMTLASIGQALQGGGQALSTSIRSPLASRVTIYGQTRVAGVIVYMSSIKYTMNQIVAWASHLCQSVDFKYLDGREVIFLGTNHVPQAGASGFDDGETFYDTAGNAYNFGGGSGGNYHVYVQDTLGTAGGQQLTLTTGTPSPSGDGLVWNDPNWTSECTLNGICASFIATASDPTMFASIPGPKAAIHGKCDIYDPRLGAQFLSDGITPNPATHLWTANAALIVADFLVNLDFGVGCSWSEIDIDQLIVAANICDEQVELAGVSQPWESQLNVYEGTQILDSNGNIETATYVPTGDIGETGLTQPTWPTTVGATTVDNNVTWTMSLVPATPTTESRYTINGSFDWSTAPGDILTSMLAAMEARISYQGGVWKIFPAAWYGSTLSFDLGDVTGPIKWSPKRKFRDLFNAVRATFVCPSYPYAISGFDIDHKANNIFDGQFQPTDAPEYAQDYLHGYGEESSPYGGDVNLQADAGIKLYTDVRYQFVNSVSTCQRLMKIRLLRNRFQGTGTLQMSLSAYQTCPVDVIQMTAAPLSWTNKYLEVGEFHFVPTTAKPSGEDEGGGSEDEQAITLGVQLDVNETDPSIYAWSTVEERSLTNTNSPQLLMSNQVADPTNLTLSSSLATALVTPDGLVQQRILAQWTEPNDPFTTSGGCIAIQYQLVGASAWSDLGTVSGSTSNAYIPCVSGQTYNVQIQARHASGACGDWITETIIVGVANSNVYGAELLGNGGFENNTGGTPLDTLLAQGASCSDGWMVSALQGPWQVQINNAAASGESSYQGNNSLVIMMPSGTVSAGTARVMSSSVPVTPGQVLSYGGYTRWDANAAIPSGVTILQRIGIMFFNAAGQMIEELYPGDIDNTVTGGTWGWNQQGICTVPAGAVAAQLECCGFETAGSGSCSGLCAVLYFDECYLISGTGTSTALNGQGSIVPSQPISYSTTMTNSSVGMSWGTQSIQLSDGSVLVLQAGSVSYTGLSASTTYYLYPYISALSGIMGFTNGNPPPTSQSGLMAIQAASDGRIYLGGSVALTTLASGNTGTGAGFRPVPCPEISELVDVQGKGQIASGKVISGDLIRGKSVKSGQDVYRKVLQTAAGPCAAWWMVNGHRCSPCEAVYFNNQWMPAFRVPGATLDTMVSQKAMISVEADEYGEHNYYLVGGSAEQLIHNLQMGC
jgi:hypothetical protein